jgi:hypothetical protein
MFAAHKIPPSYELHSTNFLNGRGHPSLDPAWNDSKEARRNLVEQALTVIGTTPQMSVGTVYRHTAARRRDYNRERGEVYARLVAELDARLGRVGEHGLIFMDGAGTDPAYYAAHRALKLAHRNVIEDPLFQHSHRSQWVQMADIAAYTAYQGLIRVPAKQFAWDWYTDHLGPIDVNGGPMAL